MQETHSSEIDSFVRREISKRLESGYRVIALFKRIALKVWPSL